MCTQNTTLRLKCLGPQSSEAIRVNVLLTQGKLVAPIHIFRSN